MNALRLLVVAALILATLAAPAQAQTGTGGSTTTFNHAIYETCFASIPLVIAAGCATWYVDSPSRLSPGQVGGSAASNCSGVAPAGNCYFIGVTATVSVSPVVTLTLSGTGTTTYGGCHVGTLGTAVSATNGNTIARGIPLGVDPGTTYCGGLLNLQLTANSGSVIVSVILAAIEFYVPVQDTKVRLCDASEFTFQDIHPDSHIAGTIPYAEPCTTPSVNVPDVAAEIDQLRVDLCDNPSGHGHCSLDIHGGIEVESPDIAAALADVAAAIETLNRLRVQVCGSEGDVEGGACSIPRVHVENFTANVGIGNQSVSFPSNLTVAATFPGDVDAPGFDFWALFIFWVVLLGFLLYQGWYFAAAFAVPGLLDAMFPGQIPETFATWFVFVMLGCVLEVAASKFRWGAYRQKSGMRA